MSLREVRPPCGTTGLQNRREVYHRRIPKEVRTLVRNDGRLMSSAPSVAEVQLRMAQVRADLQRSAEGLKHNAQTLTDWRYYVRQHPWLAVGAAGAVAFLAVPRRTKPVSLDA